MFRLFMLICAFSTITIIWLGKEPDNTKFFMIVPATFILGLASALVWLPHTIYRFIDAVGKG